MAYSPIDSQINALGLPNNQSFNAASNPVMANTNPPTMMARTAMESACPLRASQRMTKDTKADPQ